MSDPNHEPDMTPSGTQVLLSIRRTLRGLIVTTLVLIAVLAGAIAYNAIQAAKVQSALCSLRGNLVADSASTQKFLDDNPGPTPIANVPRSVLEGQVAQQQASIRALAPLGC